MDQTYDYDIDPITAHQVANILAALGSARQNCLWHTQYAAARRRTPGSTGTSAAALV